MGSRKRKILRYLIQKALEKEMEKVREWEKEKGREKEKENKEYNGFEYEVKIKNPHLSRIKVSIIMPSYNKYEYSLLSLYCLEKQTFNPSEFEVIFIDDCSLDKTSLIADEFNPLFKFKYIRPKQNIGRSKARNLGLKHAEGEIIIFLDAEMLTEPDFVQNHFNHHLTDKNKVVCGAMHYRGIYTFLTREFNRNQWEHIDSFVGSDPFFTFSFINYKQNHADSHDLYPLITKKHIDDNSFRSLSFPNWYFNTILNSGLNDFGSDLSNFTLPYIALLTGDVSVHRSLLAKAGHFDESFLGYGAEDWELGYRLYKKGARFILDPKCFCYHQEHPTSPNNFPEAMNNLYKFMIKHPHIEVLALALEHKPALSFTQIHYIVSQYNELNALFPQDFELFKKVLCSMMLKVIEKLKDQLPIENLHKCSPQEAKELVEQLYIIKENQWHALANTFEELFKL